MTQAEFLLFQQTCNHEIDFREWSCAPGSPVISFHCPKCQKVIMNKHLEDCPRDMVHAYFELIKDQHNELSKIPAKD